MANRCDFYSDEEYEYAQQMELEEYREQLAYEEAYAKYCEEEFLKEELKRHIMKEIDFSKLHERKNKGIFEFHKKGGKSLGISYEDIDDKKDVYIYNVFVGSEYINISGEGTFDDPLPDDVLTELFEAWYAHYE